MTMEIHQIAGLVTPIDVPRRKVEYLARLRAANIAAVGGPHRQQYTQGHLLGAVLERKVPSSLDVQRQLLQQRGIDTSSLRVFRRNTDTGDFYKQAGDPSITYHWKAGDTLFASQAGETPLDRKAGRISLAYRLIAKFERVGPCQFRLLSHQVTKVTMKRGTLDMFVKPQPKKPKYEISQERSYHATYPFSVPHLPAPLKEQLGFAPAAEGKVINDQRDLDLVYYQPYIPSTVHANLFSFLRQELFYYRVRYNITRGGIQTTVNTPRFTTVFGVDATSHFTSSGSLIDAVTGRPVEHGRYQCKPRPLPQCLDDLRKLVEGTTGRTYNFCLVNYYADGNDSISYHSDDERFLGANPAIASLSLGARRDFLLKHKPIAPSGAAPTTASEPKQIKLPLGSGDMVLMRGTTQANWLHSIPKRAGDEAKRGRINITFRKALVKGGTENYYQYNVGSGAAHRWNAGLGRMVEWTAQRGAADVIGPQAATGVENAS